MTLDRDLDRRLVAWFDDRAGSALPEDLLARSLARVDATRQRGSWLVGGNVLRGRVAVGRALVPTWVVLAVLALVTIAVVAVGARLALPAVVLEPSATPSQPASETPRSTEPTPSATAVALLGGGPILAQTFTGFGDPGPFDVVAIDPETGATTLLGRLPGKSVTGSANPYTFLRNADLTRVVLDRPLDAPTAAAERFGFTVGANLGSECCANGSIGWIALSPSGDRVAAVHSDSSDRPIELVVVDLGGRVTTRLPIPSTMTRAGPLRWAPDGRSLLVSGCRPCNKAEAPGGKQTADHAHLYVVPIDGSAWRELLDLDNGALTAQWSPDGTRLAVERYVCAPGSFMPRCDPAETSDTISVLDLATETETPLGDASFISEGDWSPDGTRIAYGARDGTFVVDATTGARTKVASGQSYGADWSPDGLWLIAKSELAGPDTDDEIVRADGTQLHLRLTGFAAATW